jgi:hypothetical protein
VTDYDTEGEPAYFPGAPVLRECNTCGKLPELVPSGLKFCGKCKKVLYCSVECQKKDWDPFHKKWCKAFAKMPEPPAVEDLSLDADGPAIRVGSRM